MIAEPILQNNLLPLVHLMLGLWPDSSFDEELAGCHTILTNENETCYLIKNEEEYIAFIHITIRFDYVEGADDSPVAYIEGMFVKEAFRHLGVGQKLITLAADWGRQKNCRQLASDTEVTNTGSIDFHLKSGFTEANRIVCFIKEL